MNLVGLSKATHAAHDAEHVVVASVYADLSSVGAGYGSVGKNELKGCVVDAGHVAGARRLVLLRAKSEGVYVDTGVRSTGVVLEGLNLVEVGALTLREAVLAVKLELSGNNRVLTPAVHLVSGLSKNEGTGIGNTSKLTCGEGYINSSGGEIIVISKSTRSGSGVIEKTRAINNGVGSGNLVTTRESTDGVRKSINGIGVVERLGTKSSVENLTALK